MIAFICLFLPAVLAMGLFERIGKTKLNRRQWFYRYCTNTLLINLICFAAMGFWLNTADAPFYTLYTDTTPAAALHYLIMAIPAAVILAFLQILLAKHTTITVEAQENA